MARLNYTQDDFRQPVLVNSQKGPVPVIFALPGNQRELTRTFQKSMRAILH